MYASPARSTMISGALHGAAIVLVLLTTGVKTSLVKNTDHVILFTPLDLMKYEITVPQPDDAGGGGGMRAKTAASLGSLPPRKLKQFLTPMVKVENTNPILTMEPSIIASPEIAVPQVNLAVFGDPHGVAGPPSAGPGKGGGIGWGLAPDIQHAVISEETILDRREYHTINEVKNGIGPAPLKTEKGWLHLAHGVRNTAAGLRYVLYCFLCDLEAPYKVIAKPGGYFLAPEGEERVGDVSNVTFSNGWVQRGDEVLIYYGASDTRTNVASTTVDRLLDYVLNTPPDAMYSAACVRQRIALIDRNLRLAKV